MMASLPSFLCVRDRLLHIWSTLDLASKRAQLKMIDELTELAKMSESDETVKETLGSKKLKIEQAGSNSRI